MSLSRSQSTDDVSYSMIVDSKSVPINSYDSVLPRSIHRWVKDSAVNNCFQCNAEFSFLYRKHHCRMCGRIFCYKCSSNNVVIPSYVKRVESPKWFIDDSKEPVRVCDSCFDLKEQLENLYHLIMVFNHIDLSIEDYKKMLHVSKLWRQLGNYYLSKFREIQYHFPNHNYTKLERKMLWNSRHSLVSHSRWQIHLLMSCQTETQVEELIALFSQPRRRRCWYLMCSRSCNHQISPEESLTLFHSPFEVCQDWALQFLDQAPDEELVCYVPFLVQKIRKCPTIGKYLINRAKKSHKIANEVYWQLKMGKELDMKSYNTIYQAFLRELDNDYKMKLESSVNLINILQNLPVDLSESQIREILPQLVSDDNMCQIASPIDPDAICVDLDAKHIQVKESATRPIIIPLDFYDEEIEEVYTTQLLYKNEDLRKDQVISNIIQLSDFIIKKELGDMNILTYQVRPTGLSSGVIEIVPDCDTIYHIKEREKKSILNYIIENNSEENGHKVRERFTKSCAGYCVLTYLLGVGDRHLENIMVTKNGILFHIDFDFILGNDAKPFTTPTMRISPSMVDALGGVNSQNYMEFKVYCNQIFDCLRRHIDLYVNMLSQLTDLGLLYEQSMMVELIKRFIPGESYEQAQQQLGRRIDRSSSSNGHAYIDFFHYHKKEKTVTNMVTDGYSAASSWLRSFYKYIQVS